MLKSEEPIPRKEQNFKDNSKKRAYRLFQNALKDIKRKDEGLDEKRNKFLESVRAKSSKNLEGKVNEPLGSVPFSSNSDTNGLQKPKNLEINDASSSIPVSVNEDQWEGKQDTERKNDDLTKKISNSEIFNDSQNSDCMDHYLTVSFRPVNSQINTSETEISCSENVERNKNFASSYNNSFDSYLNDELGSKKRSASVRVVHYGREENELKIVLNFQNPIINQSCQVESSCSNDNSNDNESILPVSTNDCDEKKLTISENACNKKKTKRESQPLYYMKVMQLRNNSKSKNKNKTFKNLNGSCISKSIEVCDNSLHKSKYSSGFENKKGTSKLPNDDFFTYLLQKNCEPTDNAEAGFYIPPPHPLQSVGSCSSSDQTSEYLSGETERYEKRDVTVQLDEIPSNKLTHVQIKEISLFLKETESKSLKTSELADKVREDVNAVVRYIFRGDKVLLYGSYLSGLAVNTSNINLALQTSQTPKDSLMELLRKRLYDRLEKYDIEPYEPASNPKKSKIHFTEPEYGIACEIVFARSTVENALKMNEMLKNLCKLDDRVKTLIISTRIFAEECGIHEAESGKLHTIGFAILVIYFLQQLKPPILPIVNISSEESYKMFKSSNQASIGELWMELLEFYGNKFGWESDVVCITSKSKISKEEKNWAKSFIAIEDPFTLKNIADSVKKADIADHIHSCFKEMHKHFLQPENFSDSSSSSSFDSDDERRPHGKYSFSLCRFLQEKLPLCEDCEEIGGLCEKCLNLPSCAENVPAICQASLQYVSNVLDEVFGKNILPEHKIKGRMAFVRDLEKFIRQKFRDATLSLFGSSVNGFGFESSDLDICLTLQNKLDLSEVQKILKQICNYLRRDKNHRYYDVVGLYRALIPLIKFSTEPEMDWKCDISIDNILPVHNSRLLNAYASFDIRCRKLGCALKLLAKKAGLMDQNMKSLSSYSYILMTIHFLQQVEPPVVPVFPIHHVEEFSKNFFLPNYVRENNHWFHEDTSKLRMRYKHACQNSTELGELWLGLLDFYLNFDMENAVTIIQKEPLSRTVLERSANLYNIQDPFLQKKNLGCRVSTQMSYEMFRVLHNARILFGRKKPENVTDLKSHYFSTMNLTGKYNVKDKDCSLCGVYGHEESRCKRSQIHQSQSRNV